MQFNWKLKTIHFLEIYKKSYLPACSSSLISPTSSLLVANAAVDFLTFQEMAINFSNGKSNTIPWARMKNWINFFQRLMIEVKEASYEKF